MEGIILIVILIVLIALIARRKKRKKEEPKQSEKKARSESPAAQTKSYQSTINDSKYEEKTEKLISQYNTEKNKINKLKTQRESLVYALDGYRTMTVDDGRIRNILQEIELDEDSADIQSFSIPELKKAFKANEKEIEKLCSSYEENYETKTNKTIYRLMVLALNAELKNILTDMRFGKKEDAEQAVREMTGKYLAIVTEGNQTIRPTVTRFISQVEYLYLQAVSIEYEYYIKQEQAKEEQRAIREQRRQEQADKRANEAAQKKLREEEKKYNQEIARLKELLETLTDAAERASVLDQLSKTEDAKAEIEEKQEELLNLQNGKAGTVYVISNIGSFGEGVFKVGMTRRIDPQERVDELGDASVPFPFDVHSYIFSEDAPTLETKLHRRLDDKRVNKVNMRKEFFKVSLDELERIVHEEDPTAEFHRTVAAEQYNQSA